jgi:hypothetical protein
MDSSKWLTELKPKILKFINHQKGNKPGYYKYSYSGDLIGEKKHWNLVSAVFATKCYYMLDSIEEEERQHLIKYIKSFEKPNGEIYDPLILRRSLIPNTLVSIYKRDFKSIFLYPSLSRRGETRQSYAALFALGSKPDRPYTDIPDTPEGVKKYLNKLPWQFPWSAGSHLSHLMFFLHYNHKLFGLYKDNYEDLIKEIDVFLAGIQSEEDGCWYLDGKINNIQKINGAMKVLTGFAVTGRKDVRWADKIIDTCLPNQNDEGACSSFDVLYALNYCSQITDHRAEDVKAFALRKIDQYREYFYEDLGGFSFYKNRSNNRFYGAKITAGKDEPDIHGTVLYLWGLSVVAHTLGLNDSLKLKLPIN